MREELAALIHDMWSGWIRYVASKSTFNPDGSMTISAWAVSRRERQMKGSYDDLSEKEKDGDRRQADKVLALMKPTLAEQNIQLKAGNGWLIDASSIGARWTLECCGCGRRHQFDLSSAGPGAYQITITEVL